MAVTGSEITVAIISFVGTVIGTVGGMVTSAQIIKYRLEQLEKKVDTLSGYVLKIPVFEERLSGLNTKINDIKKEKRNYENIKMDHCQNLDAVYCDN